MGSSTGIFAKNSAAYIRTTGFCCSICRFELGLAEFDLDISAAKILTEKGAAIDSFYVRELDGGKILAPERQKAIERKLQQAIRALDESPKAKA